MTAKIDNTYYRNLIVGVDTIIPLKNGNLVPAINFDNAATTPPFKNVLNEIINFSPWYSSIHRGTGYKSQISSKFYEEARNNIGNFVGADLTTDTVIFVKNTTEAINKLSYRLCNKKNQEIILTTRMEHHSNFLPWKNKFEVHLIDVDENGVLDMNSLLYNLEKYKGKIRLVSIVGASNVTGYINPIYKIAKLVHEYGTKILVDGAQMVPHVPINMKSSNDPEHIDFLVFSAHKIYAPFGIGVLIGPVDTFKEGCSECVGGGTVRIVTEDFVTWDDVPEKEEAGTQNLIGVAALVASINTINKIGMHNIESYEKTIFEYAFNKLSELQDVDLCCLKTLDNNTDRVAIIPFNVIGMHHTKVSKILSDNYGISVRSGCFCAQPYIQKLMKLDMATMINLADNYDITPERPGMVRVSFSFYNTISEIDIFINALKEIIFNNKRQPY